MQLEWVLVPGHIHPCCITCTAVAERRWSWPRMPLEAAHGGCPWRLPCRCCMRARPPYGSCCWLKAGVPMYELPHQRGLQSLAHRCREQNVIHATCVMSVYRALSAHPVLLLHCAFLEGRRVGGKQGGFRRENDSLPPGHPRAQNT